jgi:hypothetical protein
MAGLANAAGRPRDLAAGRLRIVVLGYIVRGPLGGLAWHHLQYVMGLAGLGHDVYFLEDSDDYPSCYTPPRDTIDTDPSYGLEFARQAFDRVGLGDRWVYYDAHTLRWLGPCANRILAVCATADLLLNLSGVNPLRPWLGEVAVRALIDTDPAFTQIRHLTDPVARQLALQHTVFFSFGTNIGQSQCEVPQDGFPWQGTRQPIVLDAWPVTPGPPRGKFTTVMQWDSYQARTYNGRRYGMKSASFAEYMDLPRRAGPVFELAVGSPTTPREELLGKGWAVRNPLDPTRDPWTYQHYIRQSKAEFSVAKHGYVVSRSGWFSERSACYLASGRPVVTQETGFSDWLEAGSGVIPFSTPEQAHAGIEEVNSHYDLHCRAARAVAEEYFDARKVLPQLIECAMDWSPAPSGAVLEGPRNAR